MGDLDILCHDLSDIAALLRNREISARRVTQACLARIENEDPVLHAVAGVDPERALAAADRADAAAADASAVLPPLHGVPLAHKDMIHRRGRTSACGSRLLASYVPEVTATVLNRLDAAGALDIARLAMSEFALGSTGHNEAAGTARNPWAPGRIAGGSSSGPAVAVAAGMAFGALGSDTGGSIRQPAAFCGVVGLKPTPGRVSLAGVMPLSKSLDAVGPIARSARDAALLFRVISGPEPEGPFTPGHAPSGLDPDGPASLRGLRIAVSEAYFHEDADAEVLATLEKSLGVYRALGAEIVPVSLGFCGEAARNASLIAAYEGAALHREWLETAPGLYGAQTRARLTAGLAVERGAYDRARAQRRALCAAFADAVFETADVLFAPTMPMAPPGLADSDVGAGDGFMDYIMRFGRCTRPFSYLGLPALSVPAGLTESGLPAAFQLVGRPLADESLFAVADAYEQATDRSWRMRPLKTHANAGAPMASHPAGRAA